MTTPRDPLPTRLRRVAGISDEALAGLLEDEPKNP